MADINVKPNALPLPLVKKISDRVASNVLPLTLNRKLGTLDAVAPPPVKRTMLGASIALASTTAPAIGIGLDRQQSRQGQGIATAELVYRQMGVMVGNYYLSQLQPFTNLGNRTIVKIGNLVNISNQFVSQWLQYQLLGNATRINVSDTLGYASVLLNDNAKVVSFEQRQTEPQQPAIGLATSQTNNEHGVFIGNRSQSRTQAAIPVPWRYYAIPDEPPPPIVNTCRVRPPSSRLPLSLNRKRGELPSSALPLALTCWETQSPKFIPSLRTYIVHNVITATVGGIQVDPTGFNIKADTNGYCWQGSIELTASQYAKIKAKLDVERGNEPLITVTINGFVFAFICEDVSRNRAFINHSYSISGRSITARLGADYAHAQGGLIAQDLYASQIINMQLADTGITLDRFDVKDWRIPANTYAVTNKTPIAVIGEIAKACGGFVCSHPSEAKLSILPRWKKYAWELATANADVVLNTDVIRSMSDQKRTNPRYNTVTLIGGKEASEIYRNRQGRNLIAPVDSNILFTDRDCVVPKGAELLSDSGIHIDNNIKMRWADKYNIPLANLSEIWQVNDPEGAWKGMTRSVAVSVDWDYDAPCVWQTVNIDRYLDV